MMRDRSQVPGVRSPALLPAAHSERDARSGAWRGYHAWLAVADVARGQPGWAAYQAIRVVRFGRRDRLR
jgi:hypothetical protein